MGVENRKVSLPAPTDSPTDQTAAESSTEVDLATDISRRTDKTSYTIPEDGREITIPAKKRKEKRERGTESSVTKALGQSQTSLLIEYFEGGKGQTVQARPSVRVKVTPSAAKKIKDTNEHITVSESKGGRKPSYTRRISLGPHSSSSPKGITETADDRSVSSYTSVAEESSLAHRYPPVEIEVMHRDQDSDLSRASDLHDDRLIQQNPSEISSMPPDSMLEEQQSREDKVSVAASTTPRNRSRSTSREALIAATDTLKTPSRQRERSLSKERLAHKVMEKLAVGSGEGSSGKHRRSSKTSRSRSVSNEHAETLKTPRRRSGKQHLEESIRSSVDSSVLTEPQLSPRRQSGDQYSFRSGTSKSSLTTNPKLLETVENAIRRLIMPELENLKQEQKNQKIRRRFEEDSLPSGSTERIERKLSKHNSAPDVTVKPKVVLSKDENDPGTVISGDSIKGRKERRRSKKPDSPRDSRSERQLSEETVIHDGGSASKKRSKEGHRLRDAAAAGIAGGALTAAALSHHDMKHSESRSSVDSKERRRRRRSKSHSRSASLAESEDVFRKHDVPPMPMQSDIHSSDITRDSLLSEETDRTKSPSFEVQKATIRQMARASPREISSPGQRTPTRSNLHKSLGTHHSNLSQGDLSQQSPLSDRSQRDEGHLSKGEKASIFGGGAAAAGALAAHELHKQNDDEYAYTHEGRPLSPIQSVSSRQESEANRDSYLRRHSDTSLQDQQRRRSAASVQSDTSLASGAFDRSNRPKGINLESREEVLDQHQLRESDFTEGEYSDKDAGVDEWFQREHEKNDQYRSSIGEASQRDDTVEFKHMTNFTDESTNDPYLDQATEGQKQHSVDACKRLHRIDTPVAVESAVASLLDTSVVSARSKHGETSFIDSPDKEPARDSTYSASHEVDTKEHSPIRHDANASPQKSYLDDAQSAKESPRQSVAHSETEESEHITMGVSGVPVPDDPLPEIGYGHSESDISTNPSIIQGPIGGTPAGNRDHWPYQPTPTQPKEKFASGSKDSSAHESLKMAAAGFLSAAAVASNEKIPQEGKPRSKDRSEKDEYQPNIEDEYSDDDHDSYGPGQPVPSPPRDEGYVSGHLTGPQQGLRSPEVAFKDTASFNDGLGIDDDPFVSKTHTRHLSTNSGLARGMGSPLYDSATGNGIDRIQSKDIVALMDHVSISKLYV